MNNVLKDMSVVDLKQAIKLGLINRPALTDVACKELDIRIADIRTELNKRLSPLR